MSVGQRLVVRRRELRILPKVAADALGCTDSDLRFLESGRAKRPPFLQVMRLCRLYKIDPWMLVDP